MTAVMDVVANVKDEWIALGDRLGITWNDVKVGHCSRDLDARIYEILNVWRTKEPPSSQARAPILLVCLPIIASVPVRPIVNGSQ